jgi:hypothetical protein
MSWVAGVLAVLTAVGGYLIYRYEAAFRARTAGLSLAALGRLEWLYRLVWSAIRAVGSAVDNLATVLEGEGALLWALVAGMLVWLLYRQ